MGLEMGLGGTGLGTVMAMVDSELGWAWVITEIMRLGDDGLGTMIADLMMSGWRLGWETWSQYRVSDIYLFV